MSRRVLSGIVLSRSAHGDEVQTLSVRSLSELSEVGDLGYFRSLREDLEEGHFRSFIAKVCAKVLSQK